MHCRSDDAVGKFCSQVGVACCAENLMSLGLLNVSRVIRLTHLLRERCWGRCLSPSVAACCLWDLQQLRSPPDGDVWRRSPAIGRCPQTCVCHIQDGVTIWRGTKRSYQRIDFRLSFVDILIWLLNAFHTLKTMVYRPDLSEGWNWLRAHCSHCNMCLECKICKKMSECVVSD